MDFTNYISKLKKEKVIVLPRTQEFQSTKYAHFISERNIDKTRVIYRKGGIPETIALKEVRFMQFSPIPYHDLVNVLIRKQYSINDELEILRKKDIDELTYNEYYQYVELCISVAKDFVAERGD